MTANDIIARLGLQPHPEGGHFAETWRGPGPGRSSGTCIYFLLQGHETNRWHRVDAAEIWHFYAGAPLILTVSATDAGPATEQVLGPQLSKNQRPQVIIPAHHWQRARSTGAYTLAGCSVSPGFEFDGFTLADQGFDIPVQK